MHITYKRCPFPQRHKKQDTAQLWLVTQATEQHEAHVVLIGKWLQCVKSRTVISPPTWMFCEH